MRGRAPSVPGAADAVDPTCAVAVEHVDLHVGGRQLLHDVSLTATRGHVVGVVGPNGAGKSTLLGCLYRHLSPQRGRIVVEGRDLRHVPRREQARTVAAVPQNTPLAFDATVEDVVATGRIPWSRGTGQTGADDRDAVDRSLRQVGLEHLRHRSAATLSGGELQRAFLGRALAQDAPVLVLDEPTNHLDLANQEQLMRLVRAHTGTTVLALHDLNLTAEHCDHVVVMAAGAVVAAGAPAEVLTSDLLADVFRVRAHVIAHPDSGRPHVVVRSADPPARRAPAATGATGRPDGSARGGDHDGAPRARRA